MQLTNKIQEALKVQVSRELVRVAIKKPGFTEKKAKVFGTSKSLPEKTQEFIRKRSQYISENRTIISVYETSFGRNWPDVRGYSKKGVPLLLQKRQLYGKNISVLACASRNGWVERKQIFGAFNAQSFSEFILSLVLDPGTVILLDNVSFHHSKVVKDAFATRVHSALYSTFYSHWFNPIELCFLIVKRAYYVSQKVDSSFAGVDMRHFEVFFDKSLGCTQQF